MDNFLDHELKAFGIKKVRHPREVVENCEVIKASTPGIFSVSTSRSLQRNSDQVFIATGSSARVARAVVSSCIGRREVRSLLAANVIIWSIPVL